jgi:hypothetical protein
MFPEVLSADVTFGICKEQRNLFRICGVDGDLQVYNAMNCFMTSKQYRAYDWAINVAFPKLVGKDVCKFNSLFTSDQEMALVLSIRKFVNNTVMTERSTYIIPEQFPSQKQLSQI